MRTPEQLDTLYAQQPLPEVPAAPPPVGGDNWVPDSPQRKNSRREVDDQRRFDTTQLSEKQHGLGVHRDYAAHFFRWGFVRRHVEDGDFILDIGCGQEQPLAKVLAMGSVNNLPARMVACDLSKIRKPFNVNWLVTLDEFNFCDRWAETTEHIFKSDKFEQKFDIVTCLEVIEHMHSYDGQRLLAGVKQILRPKGKFLLSTPVFNGRAAANHCHEYTVKELQALIEAAGFWIERRWGTFASQPELKPALSEEHAKVYQALSRYYDGDVMATFLAPLYPDHSRNNLWELRHVEYVHASPEALAIRQVRDEIRREAAMAAIQAGASTAEAAEAALAASRALDEELEASHGR